MNMKRLNLTLDDLKRLRHQQEGKPATAPADFTALNAWSVLDELIERREAEAADERR